MAVDVEVERSALAPLSAVELQGRYEALFGEPAQTRHKAHLVRRILWRLQAIEEGDLSERARRRAAELADEARLRLTAPRSRRASGLRAPRPRDRRLPAPGVVITRLYKGRLLEVTVLEDGFEYDGRRFRSLSAVARHVTGSHWSGHRFFHLPQKREEAS